MDGGGVQRIDDGTAHRARRLHRRSKHKAVEGKRVLAGLKQLRKRHRPDGLQVVEIGRALFEHIIFRDLAAQRKLATQNGNFFDVPSQGNFCVQQLIASAAIGITFVREAKRVRVGHRCLQSPRLDFRA